MSLCLVSIGFWFILASIRMVLWLNFFFDVDLFSVQRDVSRSFFDFELLLQISYNHSNSRSYRVSIILNKSSAGKWALNHEGLRAFISLFFVLSLCSVNIRKFSWTGIQIVIRNRGSKLTLTSVWLVYKKMLLAAFSMEELLSKTLTIALIHTLS